MQVQLHPGNHIETRESLGARVETLVADAVGRFARQVTRVEVYVSDDGGEKNAANDRRCTMEARVAGLEPVAVTHHAPTLREALSGAAEKLGRALDRALGRLEDRRTG